jgi:GntR family transcriptional regulator
LFYLYSTDCTDSTGRTYLEDSLTSLFPYSDLVEVSQRDPTPLHEQLAAVLRAQIASGEITDMLQSESYLQQQHGVSRGTVRRAIAILAAEDLVFTIRARGTFVK